MIVRCVCGRLVFLFSCLTHCYHPPLSVGHTNTPYYTRNHQPHALRIPDPEIITGDALNEFLSKFRTAYKMNAAVKTFFDDTVHPFFEAKPLVLFSGSTRTAETAAFWFRVVNHLKPESSSWSEEDYFTIAIGGKQSEGATYIQ